MRIVIFAISLSILTSCLQTENSSSLDSGTYADVDPLFREVKDVLIQNCNSCHGYQALTEDDFIDSGLVIPGDYLNSPLYYRMINSDGVKGPKNMPLGSNMTLEEITSVEDWIQSL